VTSRPDSARRGALLVAAAAACWSSGGLIARLVTTTPWTTNFWRGLFAAVFLALVLTLVRRRSILAQWYRGGRPVLAAAVCMALASTSFIFALAHTSVANTLVLMSTGPFVAGLLGRLLLGEPVAPRTWLTMGVALAGVVLMVSRSWGRGALLGDLLAIVMATSFATATVIVRRHPEIQMAPAAALATALTALVALPLADPLATTPRDLLLLAFFGIGQFGAGFLLFMVGARLIPAAESLLIGMLETVLGPLWVWLALGERPDGASLAGGALIVGALAANAIARR
jgi:drug/metabolite transporter (DMT)-like permease